MPSAEDPFARVRRLCGEHKIVPAARKRTRYPLTDRVDDAGVQQKLYVHLRNVDREDARLGRRSLSSETDAIVAEALGVEATRVLRECLVTALTGEYDLVGVAGDACARAGLAGGERQLAYCLVVLCQKDDPPRARAGGEAARTYLLDIGTDAFADRLREWAVAVAGHLRDWGPTYAAIRREALGFETRTLRGLIPIPRRDDDIADRIADDISDLLAVGQPLEGMGLPAARATEPAGGEYVFQSPLDRWVRTKARRDRPVDTAPLDDDAHAVVGAGFDEAPAIGDGILAALVRDVARLAATRDLLADTLRLADDRQARADAITIKSLEDAGLFGRYRAELAAVADGLREERRRFGTMLEYVLLAMRKSAKRQRVAILSLRNDGLDARVIEHMTSRLRAIADRGEPPTPWLVGRTERAPRTFVPANRARELRRLAEDPAHRGAVRSELARLLDELPPTVADLATIGAAVPDGMRAGAVGTTRGHAVDELTAVHATLGRCFRRYAMRPA